jgi:hypothetical protein
VKPKNFWTVGGLLLMTVIMVSTALLGVMPTLLASQALVETKAKIDQGNISRGAFLAKLQASASNKAALAIDLAQKRALFPARLANVELMDSLNAVAANSGVEIGNLTTSTPQLFVAPASVADSARYARALQNIPPGALYVSEISVSFSGSITQLSEALNLLQSGSRYILVYRITLPESSETTPGIYALDISAQVFMLKY